jgi:hypothetical protein
MSMKRRRPEQSGMRVATRELPRSSGPVFYEKLNEVLAQAASTGLWKRCVNRTTYGGPLRRGATNLWIR